MVCNGQNMGMSIPEAELEFILETFNLFPRGFRWIKPLDCPYGSRIVTSFKYSPGSAFTNDVGRSISGECSGEDKESIQLLLYCHYSLNLGLYLDFVNGLDARLIYDLAITDDNKPDATEMSVS